MKTEEKISLKEKIIYAFSGLILFGGSFLLGRKLVLKAVSNREENKTFDSDSSATYAKQIKMSFENDGWPGTDEPMLRSVLQEIPSKTDFNKVVQSYKRLYNRNMMSDMSDELKSSEYTEMLNIIASKPERKGQSVSMEAEYTAWAKRLKAAFDYTYFGLPGTDDAAVTSVFREIPTQSAFAEVGKIYKKLFGNELLDDLYSESELGEYSSFMSIIKSKP
ncbi:MAG: hypothetical protein WC223_05070 [Bacteroidales bacterium]|jgi:hypothetical protein